VLHPARLQSKDAEREKVGRIEGRDQHKEPAPKVHSNIITLPIASQEGQET